MKIRPTMAFRDTQLSREHEELPVSGNEVFVVRIQSENGGSQKAYYKPINGSYSLLLALYCVAVSVRMRMSLGVRAAEERLVFNDNNEIVGTVSLAIPGFKPMAYSWESADPNERQWTHPNVSDLIEADVARLLMACEINENDDLHAGNISLFPHPDNRKIHGGIIDYDMFLFGHEVEVIKGRRLLHESSLGQRNSNYWHNWPNNSPATHWLCKSYPENCNLFKVFACAAEAQMLVNNPWTLVDGKEVYFHQQMYRAMFAELMAFDPEVLKTILDEYCGAVPLDYSGLEPKKIAELMLKSPHLFNEHTNGRPFSEHMVDTFQERYDKFYASVVFYFGSFTTPSFQDMLEMHPTWVAKTIKELVTNNHHYDVKRLNRRFHQLWRDCFAPFIHNNITKLHKLAQYIGSKNNLIAPFDYRLITKSAHLFDIPGPTIIPSMLTNPINKDIHLSLCQLISFNGELRERTHAYMNLPTQALEPERNSEYLADLEKLIKQYSKILEQYLSASIYIIEFKEIIASLKAELKKFNLVEHLERTEDFYVCEQLSSVMSIDLEVDHTEPTVVNEGLIFFYNWLERLDKKYLVHEIIFVLNSYNSKKYAASSRTPHVLKYLAETTDSNANIIAYLLSHGGALETSFNSALITPFIKMMCSGKDCANTMFVIRSALEKHRFNYQLYLSTAIEFARDNCSFTHFLGAQTIENFLQELFDWADEQSVENLMDLINSAQEKYVSGQYLLRFFSSPARITDILRIKNEDIPNSHKLAKLFQEGGYID